MRKKTGAQVLSLALVLAMAGSCVCGAENAQAAKKTKLKTKSVTLKVGSKKKIQIKGKKSKAKYTFKASNKKIKVSSAGVIKAVKAGKAKVTVKETYKKNKKKKTTKLGTVKVTVKAKGTDKTTGTTEKEPTASAPAASATVGTSATSAPAAQTTSAAATPSSEPSATPDAVATAKPTIVPAYETRTLDFDGSTSKTVESELTVPLGEAMIYGGRFRVIADFSQETGSDQEITVGYEDTYLELKLSGAYVSSSKEVLKEDSQSFSCPSGTKSQQIFTFDVPKYSNDFNLKFSGQDKFVIENVTIQTMPFDGADYSAMVANSTSSTGNNARIKKAIEKARAGEDVTLAYLGGSITEGFAASETDNSDCYAETSYKQFKHMFGAGDGENVHFINAGMSGTPSSLGVVRYQRDVLDQMKHGEYPDILFIDFAVNDGEDSDTYESLIRNALDQGSAVVLMFVLFTRGNGRESSYTPIGEHYDLAMVSPNQGMTTAHANKTRFDDWFYWPDGHPDVGGHRYMADCITNMFMTIDQEETEEDNIKSLSEIEPLKSDDYVGMKTLVSSTDITQIEAVKSVVPGGFSVLKDNSQPTLQYIKDGQKDMQWFPDVWAHTSSSGSDSFQATINCRSIIVAYKQASGNAFGKADCYIDGEKVGTLSNSVNGWGNASLFRALHTKEVKEHKLEIKMQDGDESKPFTIYAIGYCD